MPEEELPQPSQSARRRRGLTPEERRFLNTPRAAPAEDERSVPQPQETSPTAKSPEPKPLPPEPAAPAKEPSEKGPVRPAAAAPPAEAGKASRVIELQHAVLALGAILLLGLTFYCGTKFNYLRYLMATRHKPTLAEGGPDLFPGVAAEDLVRQALQAEREGHWEDAATRLMAAKRKDLHYRGILFRVGKLLYDHRNFDAADTALNRAIAFNENLDGANFYRGLIAVRHRDLAAAERFFEAAIAAAPFLSDYHYYAGETLRLDLKPKPAISCYERATLLARTEQDATVCQFKVRMARIEAAESSAVSDEVAKKSAAGALSVDWLMTAAAIDVREGRVEEARQRIMQAREAKAPGLFASCVNDLYFRDLAKKYPELSEALHLDLDLQVPFPD